jgi:hypothetical protein
MFNSQLENKFYSLTFTILILDNPMVDDDLNKIVIFLGHDFHIDETVFVKFFKINDLNNIDFKEMIDFLKKYIKNYSEIIKIYNNEFNKTDYTIEDILIVTIDNTNSYKNDSLDYSLQTNNRIKSINHFSTKFNKFDIPNKDLLKLILNNKKINKIITWDDFPIHLKNKLFQIIVITSSENFKPFTYFVDLDFNNFIES